MEIGVYDNIPRNEIEARRTTSEGKGYTLDHPDELVVSMRYIGEGKSNANSQGWERSSSYYFKEVQLNHPEYFSKKNTALIEAGKSPRVDAQFTKKFPQYKGYEGETLVHHHIGQDGQAVAVPQSMHKGYGEIHSVESELGITANAQNFSNNCKSVCEKDFSCVGKTSDEFRSSDMAMSKGSNVKGTEDHSAEVKSNAFTKAQLNMPALTGASCARHSSNAIQAATSTSASQHSEGGHAESTGIGRSNSER